MIDWITLILDYDHSENDVNSGYVVSSNKHGEVEWQSKKAMFSDGSYSTKVKVKSHGISGYKDNLGHVRYSKIYIDGNPAKYLYGHNITGSNNLIDLVRKFVIAVFNDLGLKMDINTLIKLCSGEYLLNRVDCTDYLHLKNNLEVDLILNRLSETATYFRKGRAVTTKGTVYFGQNSTWYAIKFYNKYKELSDHKIPLKVPHRDKLKDFVINKLRTELVLRKRELMKNNLHIAKNWNNKTVVVMLNKYVNNEKIHITETSSFEDSVIVDMPRSLRSTYALWQTGINLTSVMSKTTFYRHRTELFNYGIDISSQPPKEDNTVVSLHKKIDFDLSFQETLFKIAS